MNVGILGATGTVGQQFIKLLHNHPWFKLTALAASDRSVGQEIHGIKVSPCRPDLDCKVVFSALDSSVAGDIESLFATAGYTVISNSKNHRMDTDVPLLIPEVNSAHLNLVEGRNGCIVTNPNCSVVGIAMALKPLVDHWGVSHVQATTLQALSGAGRPGISGMDIIDNVIPYISGEEDKVETEPQKILDQPEMIISAQCNRVPVIDGHLACLSVKLKKSTSEKEMIDAWNRFPQLNLPSAPKQPIIYWTDPQFPQPRLHRDLGNGMTVSVGRLQRCNNLDWKFVVLVHNTIRGAAGGAILNAELMKQKGLIS